MACNLEAVVVMRITTITITLVNHSLEGDDVDAVAEELRDKMLQMIEAAHETADDITVLVEEA